MARPVCKLARAFSHGFGQFTRGYQNASKRRNLAVLFKSYEKSLLGHSKRREKPGCKNQTIEKLRDPSHFLGPIFVNPKHPFPATKRAFEVNKGRTDVSTSRYERIVKFDKVFVTGVEVFVTSHKDLCTCALWSSATIIF